MIHFLRYIRFLWLSKNAHGVHSPFVYNLAVKCLLDFSIKPEYEAIDAVVAQHKSGLSQKHARLLFRILNYLQPAEAFYEGTGNAGLFGEIVTQITNCNIQIPDSKLKTLDPKLTTSNPQPAAQNPQLQIVNPQPTTLHFIDTKNKAAAQQNFRKLLIIKNNNTILLFNNIYASAEMQEAWHSIKNNQEVTVSIDTFYFGLIFFRKEQAREHFKIRITSSGLLNTVLGAKKLWGLLD